MKSLLLPFVAMISIQAFAQTTGPIPTAPGVSPNPGLTPGVVGPLAPPSVTGSQAPVGGFTPSPTPTLTPGVTEGLTPNPITGLTPNPVGGLTPNPVGGLTPNPVGGLNPNPVTGLSQPETTIGTVPGVPDSNPIGTPIIPVTPTNGLTPSPF